MPGSRGNYRAKPLEASPLANLFRISPEAKRDDVIEQYIRHLSTRPDLCAEAKKLRGKVLVCWCAPKPCHGNVLAVLADSDCDCCHMAGVYNGFHTGPHLFDCQKACGCHD